MTSTNSKINFGYVALGVGASALLEGLQEAYRDPREGTPIQRFNPRFQIHRF
jgi:hypothetical protein